MSNNPNIVQNATSTSSLATANNLNYSFNSNLNNNNNNQDFSESISRALDQTKDNINRSIEESKNQIPQYNNVVNSYQEQTLQAAKEISDTRLPAGPANLARSQTGRFENGASRRVDAHRRRVETIGRRSRGLADWRGGAAERRRGQFRRDRSGNDFHVSQPQNSSAHGRFRRRTSCARCGDQ